MNLFLISYKASSLHVRLNKHIYFTQQYWYQVNIFIQYLTNQPPQRKHTSNKTESLSCKLDVYLLDLYIESITSFTLSAVFDCLLYLQSHWTKKISFLFFNSNMLKNVILYNHPILLWWLLKLLSNFVSRRDTLSTGNYFI